MTSGCGERGGHTNVVPRERREAIFFAFWGVWVGVWGMPSRCIAGTCPKGGELGGEVGREDKGVCLRSAPKVGGT